MDNLEVFIPVNFKSGLSEAERHELIANKIKEYENEFTPLFERLIDMGDARMTVMDSSLIVTGIDILEVSGSANVMFDSDFYAGCKDMNSTDEHEAVLDFEINNDGLYFEIDLPEPWLPD